MCFRVYFRRPAAVLAACALVLQGRGGAARAQGGGGAPEAAAGAPALTSAEQEARLRKFLPRTYPKLVGRKTIRVAVTGDSISQFYQPAGRQRYDSAKAWHGWFLSRLASRFFYNGSVVDIDPHREVEERAAAYQKLLDEWASGGKPPSVSPFASTGAPVPTPQQILVEGIPRTDMPEGEAVIRVHNLARGGSLVPHVMEALHTYAWAADPGSHPDLVMICYGVNDANAAYPLSFFRDYLKEAIRICRSRGADVILAGPPLILTGEARDALARTRPYSAVAREVADEAGVFFADLGRALARRPSDLQSLKPGICFAGALLPVRRYFDHGPDVEDLLHINGEGARVAGEVTAEELVNGSSPPALEVSGALEGPAGPGEDGILTLRVFNPTDREITAVVCPLGMTGYAVKPGTPDRLVTLQPKKGRRLTFPCTWGTGRDPEALTAFQQTDGGLVRGAIFLCDDDTQEIVDFAVPVLPVALDWSAGRFDRQTDRLRLRTGVINSGRTDRQVTAEITWMGKTQRREIAVPAGGRTELPLELTLPPAEGDVWRFRETVAVTLEADGRQVRYERGIEAVRHLGLEQRIPLTGAVAPPYSEASAVEPAAWVTISANAHGIYFVVDIPPGAVSGRTEVVDWGSIRIQLDGRGPSANGGAGFVDRLDADIPWSDGPLKLNRVRPAVFGETYRQDFYHPGWVGVRHAFPATVSTRPNGARRVEFSVARAVLDQHDWSLDGRGQNQLGFNLHLAFADPSLQSFNPAATCHISRSGIAFNDPRSLTALELTRSPSPGWSIRID